MVLPSNMGTPDFAGYIQGSRQATAATQQFQDAVGGLTQNSVVAGAVLNRMIPAAAFLGLGKFAREAANAQSELSGLRATSALTGQSVGALTAQADKLARNFAVGNAGARALITQIQGMGISAKGSEGQIGSLAERFIKLSAVTGTSSAAIAQGMVNLSRAFGDQNISPVKVEKLGDSLVTLKAKFGGSAESILGFSQAIAPFARQAGLSAAATLGIAGAFQKLGDDSNSAATAVNKVLSDITRSVRDGGPQMLKYASIVGMTAKQFEGLFKANPAQALSQVTTALGRPGAASQRNLESLGLDGIRTQRALTELTQNGGLASAISTSVNADSGATNKAASQAMGGFNDNLVKLQASAQQAAEKLGAPILGPLTSFASALNKIVVGPFAQVVGSGIGQKVLEFGLAFGIVARLARSAIGTGLKATLASAGYNSGTAQAFRAGRLETRTGLQGEELVSKLRADRAELGNGPGSDYRAKRRIDRQIRDVQYAQRLFTDSDEKLGSFANTQRKAYGIGQGSTELESESRRPRGFFRNAIRFAGLGAGGVISQAYGDPARVQQAERPEDYVARTKNPIRRDFVTGLGGVKDAAAAEEGARAKFSAGLNQVTNTFRRTQIQMAESGGFAARGLRDVGATALVASKAMLSQAGSGLKQVGSYAASALGGPIGIAMVGLPLLIAGFSKYQEIGKKNEAVRQDFRGSSITATADLYNNALGRAAQSTQTMADVMVNAADKLRKIRLPSSAADSIKVSANDIVDARKQKDVLHNYQGGTEEVAAQINATSILAKDPSYMQATKIDLLRSGRSTEQVEKILGQVSTNAGPLGATDTNRILQTASRTSLRGGEITKANRANVGLISENMAQQYDKEADIYGTDYAQNERAKRANAALVIVNKPGFSPFTRQEVQNNLQDQMGKNAQRNKDGTYNVSGIDKPIAGPGAMYQALTGGENYVSGTGGIASLFDKRTALGQNNAVTNIRPDDPASMAAAVKALVDASQKAGESLGGLGDSAGRAAANLVDGAEKQALLQTQAYARSMVLNTSTSEGQAAGIRMTNNFADANIRPTSMAEDTQRKASAQATIDDVKQYAAAQAQRLLAQQNFEISSGRSNTDFATSTQRNQYAFDLSRLRADESFHRSLLRSEDAFARSRARTMRDHNLQMTREAQDAAKSMYDPYTRAAVESIWDVSSLLQNMQEQNRRIQGQRQTLRTLRREGVSNQTIQTLGLADSTHAQQADELARNLASDPGAANQLNTSVRSRIGMSGGLYQDPGNVSAARQAQDFKQSLADQNKDYRISKAQQLQDYTISRQQQHDDQIRSQDIARHDFNLGQDRMREDLRRSQLSITTDFSTLQAAMNRLNKGQAVDFRSLMTDTLSETEKQVKSKGLSITRIYNGALGALAAPGYQPGDPAQSIPGSAGSPSGSHPNRYFQSHPMGGPSSRTDYVSPSGNALVTSGFGPHSGPTDGGSTYHEGIDYSMPIGTRIRAAFDGIVESERRAGGYGNLLVINHGQGRETLYGHLSGYDVPVGTRVKAGQDVARSGNTGKSSGPHLHFETRQDGIAINPNVEIPLWEHSAPVKTGPIDPFAHIPLEKEDGSSNTHIRRLMSVALNKSLDRLRKNRASGSGMSSGYANPAMYAQMASQAHGSNVDLGQSMAKAYGWDQGAEWSALKALWQQESGWGTTAGNPSAAYGIPQSYPGNKMASFGADWLYNPATQIAWGLDYIKHRSYGDPIGAQAHKQATDSNLGSTAQYAQPGGWYKEGGVATKAKVIGVGESGPEAIIPLNQKGISFMVAAMRAAGIGHEKKVDIAALLRSVAPAMASTRIVHNHNNSTNNQDYSTRFTGPITVRADDPHVLAAKLTAETSRRRMTASPTSTRKK